jgi:hypothetical protein
MTRRSKAPDLGVSHRSPSVPPRLMRQEQRSNSRTASTRREGGTTPGQMLGPHGMDLTPQGCLYVEEQTGERIDEFAVFKNGVTTCTL